jgi:periplasmic copper chaperone A
LKRNQLVLIAAIAGALAAPAIAQAHVTVQPESLPAGGFARLDVRVPNERDDAATEKVEVQMPDGFLAVSYEPEPGWSVDVKSEKLDQPAELFGEEVDEQIDTVTFIADDPSAAIQPGQFRDFGLSVGMPEEAAAGETLTFPALQTYDSGEVVRWIGPPDAEEPAAEVTLTAGEDEAVTAAADDPAATEDAAEAEEDEDEGAPVWLTVVALILGALGLLVGAVSLTRRG